MDFSSLLQQLDNISTQNQNQFKDITGVMYFNDEEFQMNANFLNDNDTVDLYSIKSGNSVKASSPVNQYKKLSQKVKSHIDLEEYNLSSKMYNLSEAILSLLNFQNYNGKNMFFKKLLKEFDTYKLYKKFNLKKVVKKNLLRKALIEKNDNDPIVRQFLAEYLNLNLVILSNDSLNMFCKDRTYEVFRPTIVIYQYETSFNTLSDKITDNGIFTSEDHMNMRLMKFHFLKQITNGEPKKSVKKQSVLESIKKEEVKPVKMEEPELVNFSKLKVAELRDLCNDFHIVYKVTKSNGKKGNLTKKEMIEKLKIIIG